MKFERRNYTIFYTPKGIISRLAYAILLRLNIDARITQKENHKGNPLWSTWD